jgi:hypothetical protein
MDVEGGNEAKSAPVRSALTGGRAGHPGKHPCDEERQ